LPDACGSSDTEMPLVIFLILIGALLMLLLCLLIRDVFTFNKSEANFHNSMKMRQNSNTVMMIGTTLMDDRMKTDTDKESLTLNRLKTVEEEKLDEELNKSVSSQKSNRSSRSNRDKRR
jgi:hypothetical protein